MTSARHQADLIKPIRQAMYAFEASSVQSALADVLTADAEIHLCHPFGDCHGADDYYQTAYQPLFHAIPDLERRDLIVMAGHDGKSDWIGACGYYAGSFMRPFLDIPPTGHHCAMRFHEFYRIQDDKIVEIQAIWDIPEVMMQANAWPMAPSLGREWQVPGPATQDGLAPRHDPERGEAAKKIVIDMLTDMTRHPSEGAPNVMKLDRYWHPRMTWYGPAGIGTARGLAGFRHWHQIPFLNAMPDRKSGAAVDLDIHFFADGDYVAVTGWPDMAMTITQDGWLGIAPSGQSITIRSLDFWRLEGELIRENWVLVDLLDVYHQLGVDVLGRMREFNKARSMGEIRLEHDYQ